VDWSLLQVSAPADHPAHRRYDLYRSVADYAAEAIAPEALGAARDRHARHFAALRERGTPDTPRRMNSERRRRLMSDLENTAAAVEHALARGESELAVACCRLFYEIIIRQGPFRRLTVFLDGCEAAAPFPDSRIWIWLARVSVFRALRRVPEAIDAAERGLAIARDQRDRRWEGTLVNHLGSLAIEAGELTRAGALVREALTIHQELGELSKEASALGDMATLAFRLGDGDGALSYGHRALARAKAGEAPDLLAIETFKLGDVLQALGRLEEAEVYMREGLALFRAQGYRSITGNALLNLGDLLNSRGELVEAEVLLRESQSIHQRIGNRHMEALSWATLAESWLAAERYQDAQEAIERARALLSHDERRGMADILLIAARIHLARGGRGRAVGPR